MNGDLNERIASLSSIQRELLKLYAKKRGIDVAERTIFPLERNGNTFPLSFAQQRLWFLEQLEPGSIAYNMFSAVHMQGRLNALTLEQSFNEIIQRHEILRTIFMTHKGQPVQVIAPVLILKLPVVELRGLSGSERETKAQSLAIAEAQRPFDLVRGPLVRFVLLRLDEEEHVLLLTMHHIISDGWSMGVFVKELVTLYQAFMAGLPSPLPALRIQFADFAQWQCDGLQGQQLETQLSYWKNQLNHSTVLELPTDRPRPTVQTFHGARQSLEISKPLSEALKTLSQDSEVTIFMTLLAVFKVLLYRYTGQEDISLGSSFAGRNRAEIENLIGFFINTLVLRTDLTGNPSFRELLRRVHEVTVGALDHQNMPFEKLVEELRPERNMSHSPLFQVLFFFQPAPLIETIDLPGLVLRPFGIPMAAAKFELTLSMWETGQGLRSDWEYNTDLFDAITITRMLGHFQVLLQGIIADPDRKISDLPLLTEVEQRQLLLEWNDTRRDYPQNRCIHELFEVQAENTPDVLAVVFEDQFLTYQALNQQANQLAHYLQTLSTQSNGLIGICMERAIEMVIGLLGILKAGKAYVPIDPSYPKERLAFMLEDTAVPMLITQSRLADRLPAHKTQIVYLDFPCTLLVNQSGANPSNMICADHLAYMIYTSGSTGKPKGAMNTHGGLRNRLFWMQEAYDLTRSDRVLQKTPFSFDVSVWEFFWPLITGACLVVAQPGGHQDSAYIIQTIIEQKITTMHFVPSMLQVFLEERQLDACISLKRIISSGEALSLDLQELFFERLQAELHNLYGPTEASIDVTFWPCKRASIHRFVPIGRPIANTQIIVLDSHLNLVPIGVSGELHIGGVGLARGYLNRPDLTAEKFIPDPFSAGPGARLYKTGDLARWLPDGSIEFLGRMDHQIKIHGFRIELGEIETVLKQHPAVRETVILTHDTKQRSGDKRLIAYITSGQNPAPSSNDLRDWLRKQMPEYMVPSVFVVMKELPLTPNGKIDRKALPAPDDTRNGIDNEYAAPRTPLERKLCVIWSQVLQIEKIGIYDNFFDIGGHSLLATQIISRVRQMLGMELTLRQLFATPTIADLATHINAACSPITLSTIPIADRNAPIPLSFAQQRLWFLDQLEGKDAAAYLLPLALRLTGILNIPALHQALQIVVTRHEVLRTTFTSVDGEALQVIAPQQEVSLPMIDLSALSVELREQEVQTRAQENAHTGFDLAQSPLIRFTLFKLGSEEHALLANMHHIISDGWSIGILVRELVALYAANIENRENPLPLLPIQYVDYAVWQRNWLTGTVLQNQINYWQNQLAGMPTLLTLPTDFPRPAIQTYAGRSYDFTVNAELTKQLSILSQRSGATLFMTLTGVFAVLLARYARQADLAIGTPIANRTRQEVEDLIGFFVNTLVLRIALENNSSFIDLLGHIKQTCLDAYAHQDVPFERLVEELKPERSLSYSPLFQVMFVLQNNREAEVNLPGLRIASLKTEQLTAAFDLVLNMTECENVLCGSFEYNTDLFRRETIGRMTSHFQILLEGIVSHPEASINALPLMTESERKQVVETFNATQAAYPRERCIHQLFEDQVNITPAAMALVFEKQTLTYDQLNRKANQLARHLRALGVGPDTLTGICVERSLEMVIGLLAILKAGGAYVPMDPNYPQERIAFMLEDSKTRILLTQSTLVSRFSFHHSPFTAICLDQNADTWVSYPESNPEFRSTSSNLAYVIYTSGTTGKPKGVMIRHQSLVNAYFAWEQVYELRKVHSHLQMANVAFDVFSGDLVRALCSGGKLILCSRDYLLVPAHLYGLMQREQVECAEFVPAMLKELIRHLETTKQNLDFMRLLICGSDVLRVDEYSRFLSLCKPTTRLLNTYGLTEATIDSSYFETRRIDRLCSDKTVPIGRPFPNTHLYVLDGGMQPMPVGVPGELYVGGDGVAAGYWNRPELTTKKFIRDPFNVDSNARLYKTGDAARWLPDGNIEYLGRTDFQVKIRGFRVEIGEIETALIRHAQIREALVLVREDSSGDQRLVAYLVAKENAVPDIADLRTHLKTSLPNYMIPAAFVLLDSLPLTPNGKVDRKALPAPEYQAPIETFVAPRTPREEVLAAIFKEVLGIERVGVFDNFFELGGHSLLAVQVMVRIQQQMKADLPLTAIFEAGTVEQLVQRLERQKSGVKWSPLVRLRQGASSEVPIFCFPGAGGLTNCFIPLARHLGDKAPIYGLQIRGVTGDTVPHGSVEALAREQLSCIRDIRPEGPFRLIGHSFGGWVAFEVARQLVSEGLTVDPIILLDSQAPQEDGNSRPQLEFRHAIIEYAASIERTTGRSLGLASSAFEGLNADDQILLLMRTLETAKILPARSSLKLVRGLFQVFTTNSNMPYLATPYQGEVYLIQAKESMGLQDGLRWRFFAPSLIVEQTPGGHETMLQEPNIETLTGIIRKAWKYSERTG